MSALTAVFRILEADDDIVSLVGHRRHAVQLPQESDLPALVLTLVDDQDGRHLGGSNQYPVAHFIVDAIALRYWEAAAVGDAVKAALIDYRGLVEDFQVDDIAHDDLDFFDLGESGQVHRRRMGFRIRYRAVDDDSPPSV